MGAQGRLDADVDMFLDPLERSAVESYRRQYIFTGSIVPNSIFKLNQTVDLMHEHGTWLVVPPYNLHNDTSLTIVEPL